MIENIIYCSVLSKKINNLTSKVILWENEIKGSNNKINNKLDLYEDLKTQLHYNKAIYSNQCRMYHLFCKELFK
jgi:hypothetical protein